MLRSKTCFKCNETKPLSDFYRHNMMADGHLNKCKACAKADVRNNRKKRLAYYREYDRERGNREGPEYRKMIKQKWPQQYRAHNMVSNAVRDGRLNKPSKCENCGVSGNLHGHHDDYKKMLEVRWLCPGCHSAWHKENGPGKNRRI